MPKVTRFAPATLGDGNIEDARLNVRGDLVQMESQQQWVLEGRVWQVTVGTLSTPIVGGGSTTVLLPDQPELAIEVPSGVVVVICNVRADLQPGVTAADGEEFEVLLAVDRVAVAGITTEGTVETPLNFRTDISGGSLCTVNSAITSNVPTTPTPSMELAHPVIIGNVDTTPKSTLWTPPLFMDYDPAVKPIIAGPATILVHAGGTVATDIFCSAVWAEFTAAELGI